jgi:hypothetical protein
VTVDDRGDIGIRIGREHGLANSGGDHCNAAADLGQRARDLAAFQSHQQHQGLVVDHGEIGGLTGLVAQLAQIRNCLRHHVAMTGEGRADCKALRADMPFRRGRVELHEPALLQCRQQAMRGGGRESRAHREVAEAIAVIILGERLEDQERTVDRLHAAVAWFRCTAESWLDVLASDHISPHRDLHSATAVKPRPSPG